MKETLEKLWNEHLIDECATMYTEEERKLTNKAIELHERVNNLLNNEQMQALEEYVDALCDIEALFAKKAFFKGCEFSTSFLLEVVGLKK